MVFNVGKCENIFCMGTDPFHIIINGLELGQMCVFTAGSLTGIASNHTRPTIQEMCVHGATVSAYSSY